MKTKTVPPLRPPTVLLSVAVPGELGRAIKELREAAGISICEWMLQDPRVKKWARTHGVDLPKSNRQPIARDAQRWLDLTDQDWDLGIRHVANLLGVSRQAAARKKRLLRPEPAVAS